MRLKISWYRRLRKREFSNRFIKIFCDGQVFFFYQDLLTVVTLSHSLKKFAKIELIKTILDAAFIIA